MHAHLAKLERPGLLRRDPTKPRALELVGRESRRHKRSLGSDDDPPADSRLPLVGEIAAGGPLVAEENIEEYLPMPETMKGDFLLRVKGESMIEAGILDGDLVIVQRAQDARNGEIVVALAGEDESADEATVKTFYREGRTASASSPRTGARADLRPVRADSRSRRRGVQGALSDDRRAACTSTLDQELAALPRGATLECLVCGEFVMHARAPHFCPECGSQSAPKKPFATRATILAAGWVTAGPHPRGSRKVRTP